MTGADLKKHRRAMGFTQTELGNIFGLTKQTIINYETKSSHPVPKWMPFALSGLEKVRVS